MKNIWTSRSCQPALAHKVLTPDTLRFLSNRMEKNSVTTHSSTHTSTYLIWYPEILSGRWRKFAIFFLQVCMAITVEYYRNINTTRLTESIPITLTRLQWAIWSSGNITKSTVSRKIVDFILTGIRWLSEVIWCHVNRQIVKV